MTDRFTQNVSEFLQLYQLDRKFGNFKFISSTGSYNYYEFTILGKLSLNSFDAVNETSKSVEFILKGNTPYIKILNVPQVNVMGALEALVRLSQYVN